MYIEASPFNDPCHKLTNLISARMTDLFCFYVVRIVLQKLKKSLSKSGASTVGQVVTIEIDKKILEQDRPNSGTLALLWMKRTMQFIAGLLHILTEDAAVSLASASRQSYSKTLRHCHNFVTRCAFDAGLRFAPNKATFYKNLTGDSDMQKVDEAMRDFVSVFKPQVDAIASLFHQHNLEPYIKS